MPKYLVALGKDARGLPWHIVAAVRYGVYGAIHTTTARCGAILSLSQEEQDFCDKTLYRVCPDCRAALVAERLAGPEKFTGAGHNLVFVDSFEDRPVGISPTKGTIKIL